jgi:hypothetical protein
MSARELIVQDIIAALENAEDPRFGLVTRRPFDPAQLSRQQFPAVYVSTANEVRSDITQNGIGGLRESTLEVQLTAWVNGFDIDSQRNDVIERIEEVLDADRTRNGIARSTQVTDINVDFDVVEPFGLVIVVVTVQYVYQRGIA